MIAISMDEVNEEYLCSLCYELFLYPVTLPCKHIFCKLCFDKQVENNGFTCPLCRRRLSNWLRRLNLNKLNIVDSKLWRKIQKQYPKEVRERKSGGINGCFKPVLTHPGDQLEYSLKVSIKDGDEKDQINKCHSIEDITEEFNCEWRGWPIPDSTCRDVIHRIIQQIGCFQQITNEENKNTPIRNFAKPGEIREEFYEQLLLFQKENQQKEEESFRLSEALIKMIEEDERKEIEVLKKQKEDQLRLDEEIAKRLLENEQDSTVTEDESEEIEVLKKQKEDQLRLDEELVKGLLENEQDLAVTVSDEHENSTLETVVMNSCPHADSDERIKDTIGSCNGPTFVGPCFIRCNHSSPVQLSSHTSAQRTCSTPKSSLFPATTSRQHSGSPIPLDTPSCSKDDIFANYWTSRNKIEEANKPNFSATNSLKTPNASSDVTQAVTSISNQKLSHFAPVEAGPSSSKIGCGGKTVTVSRSSSGADSIGQELCHFKPIRTSPTTPPKDGKTSWLPQVVLAQKSITGQELAVVTNNLSPEVITVLSSNPNIDLSVEDLEESLALENQLEADRKLALQIEHEWRTTTEKTKKRTRSNTMETNYKLRKKGKASNLRKSVLMDQSQTTLDSMLIK